MRIESLPREILLSIFMYLFEQDRVSLGCCCRDWNSEILRNHCRILRIHTRKWNTVERTIELKRKIPQMIKDAYQQLEIFVDPPRSEHFVDSDSQFLFELLAYVNYSMKQLSCSIQQIMHLISVKPDIHMQTTYFSESRSGNFSTQEYEIALQHIQTVSLTISGNENFRFEHTARIGSLTPPSTYCNFSLLPRLSLWESKLSDVSMLGDIPDLSLVRCHNITDISALNHNRKIFIQYCNKISNYTQSFEFSEVIDVNISPDNACSVIINVNHWKSVKELALQFQGKLLDPSISIPFKLKGLHLVGKCMQDFNLSVTPQHNLRELSLTLNMTISSVDNLGFERLVVIELSYLPQLSSLQGLGSGRNQKIIIAFCFLITDYSPLRYVHEVHVISPESKINLDELDHVHSLTIQAKELITDPNNIYCHIYQLTITGVHFLHSMNGLERIPILKIGPQFLSLMKPFLKEGRKFYNGKLVFLRSFQLERFFPDCRLIYDRYLSTSYQIVQESEHVLVILRK